MSIDDDDEDHGAYGAGEIAHLWMQDLREQAYDCVSIGRSGQALLDVLADVAQILLELGRDVNEFANFMVTGPCR